MLNKLIVSLAYNRPNCQTEMLRYLEMCIGIEGYLTLFFVEPGCEQVLEIIKSSKLNKVIYTNDRLKGLWPNKLFSVQTAFTTNSDFIIVLEDDVLLARDALKYFEWANESFRDDKSIKTATAYHNLGKDLYHQELSHRVEKKQWYNSTAWAIWRDRYESVQNWTGEDRDLMNKLHIQQNGYEVFPLLSRAQNIGHTNGVNSPAKDILSVVDSSRTWATIGLSTKSTKDNVMFMEGHDSYYNNLLKQSIENKEQILVEQIKRCNEFTFENQLIINELGQEYIKLDNNTYKSRDNDDYKSKYLLDVWAETVKYEKKEFYFEPQL